VLLNRGRQIVEGCSQRIAPEEVKALVNRLASLQKLAPA